MKKWHFPILFLTIVAAVAVGMNFIKIYDSVMLKITGDCKYWNPEMSGNLMNASDRKQMSIEELTCSLKKYTEEMKRRNDAF